MSEWEVYLWLKLDGFKFFLWSFFIIAFTAVSLFAVMWLIQDESARSLSRYGEADKDYVNALVGKTVSGRFFRLTLPIVIIVVFPALAIPSTKEYAVIKVLPKIVNSDFAQEAVGDARMIYDVAKNYLKETLKVEAPDAKG